MATRSGASTALPGSILLVVHDFIARSPDELTLAKGDRIELIERDDEFGDGWFLGRHLTNGHSGLFPEVYTTPAPKGTLNSAQQQRNLDGLPKATAPPNAALPSIPSLQQQNPTVLSPAFSRSTPNVSSQSPLSQTSLRSPTAAAASPGVRNFSANSDSPVMSETLSVIDEHITDMHTPRSSYANGSKRGSVSSAYSSQPLNRRSYIAGVETDEEEQQMHTEEEVMAWQPHRVAEYLEDQGVEKSHCEVFLDQDISGEVLMAMDQNSLFIKEFELGSVGRRLKTWHKIKALQDEVRRSTSADVTRPAAEQALVESAGAEASRSRSSTTGSAMPRALTTRRGSGEAPLRSNTLQVPSYSGSGSSTMTSTGPSPLQTMTSISRAENPYRPSAQTIRNMNHSRRHSSIDSTSTEGASRIITAHRKQPSVQSVQSLEQPRQVAPPPYTNGRGASHGHTSSIDSQYPTSQYSTKSGVFTASPSDVDRGYFSSTEAESRARKTLIKRSTTTAAPVHARSASSAGSQGGSISSSTRQPSVGDKASETPAALLALNAVNGAFESLRNAAVAPFSKRSDGAISPASPSQGTLNRTTSQPTSVSAPRIQDDRSSEISALPSVAGSQEESASSTSNALTSINSKFEALRSAVSRRTSDTTSPTSPASPKSGPHRHISQAASPISPRPQEGDSPATSQSPAIGGGAAIKAKIDGSRSISEAVTKDEKSKTASPTALRDAIHSPSWTGTSTPSTEDKSFDLKEPDSARGSTGSGPHNLMLPPSTTMVKRPRAKSKKMTSAYTRGLEKKTPAEQMEGCDYSGWMKKKSGSLMTTWKTRLFILRGRRLSYYYSDTDTEERGLIDISFHNIVPAQDETLTGLHATVTGAAATQTSPNVGTTPTLAAQDLRDHPPRKGEEDNSGLFIFKIVPPRAGLSKGVNFTKPTVHYFAVNSRQEGRLWMAALTKAVIDRDDDGTVTTTYNQKTISLAKARARKERPPALKEDDDDKDSVGTDGQTEKKAEGLGIGGLAPLPVLDTVAGAEKENGGSTVASSVFGGSEGDVIEKAGAGLAVQPPGQPTS